LKKVEINQHEVNKEDNHDMKKRKQKMKLIREN